MFILNNKKIFLSVSLILVGLSVFSVLFFGLNFGIDFKGGAMTEISYEENKPSLNQINESLGMLGLGGLSVQPTGELGYIIKTRSLDETEHDSLLNALTIGGEYSFQETNFNSVGPSVGKELTRKALLAILLVALVIVFFIAYAFRGISKPVSSWKYGFIAIITLLHDIIIPVGIFAIISNFTGAEVDSLFVVAVLTILGLSVSDTIVIFDRVRENLKEDSKNSFEEVVGKSLSQSFMRSINTSVTTIIVLLCLFVFGPNSTKYFALMLALGMFFGTYSSIFLSSPLLVLAKKLQDK
jgi:preprotein translocase subunit SecF